MLAESLREELSDDAIVELIEPPARARPALRALGRGAPRRGRSPRGQDVRAHRDAARAQPRAGDEADHRPGRQGDRARSRRRPTTSSPATARARSSPRPRRSGPRSSTRRACGSCSPTRLRAECFVGRCRYRVMDRAAHSRRGMLEDSKLGLAVTALALALAVVAMTIAAATRRRRRLGGDRRAPEGLARLADRRRLVQRAAWLPAPPPPRPAHVRDAGRRRGRVAPTAGEGGASRGSARPLRSPRRSRTAPTSRRRGSTSPTR